MFANVLLAQAQELLDACRQKKFKLVTAESCTGGMLSTLLTEIPGASGAFERGFVTYSNQAKVELLGVDPALLDKHGAVSAQVAHAMAKGAVERTGANLAISITGVAGPDGGSREKPVGLVYMCAATAIAHQCQEFHLTGNRQQIRLEAVEQALKLLMERISE